MVFAVITLLWLGLFAVLCHYYIPRVIQSSTNSYDDLSKVRGRYVDSLSNIVNVFLFAHKRHEDKLLVESLKTSAQSGVKVWHVSNGMYIWLEVLSVLFIGSVFYYTVIEWQQGHLTLGEVAMVLPLMLRLMHISWWVSEMLMGLFENFGQVKEGMTTIMSSKLDKNDAEYPSMAMKTGHIQIQNLDFYYDEKQVFKNLNLDIKAGQKIGLVGHSGAGKTTLTQLLLRLFDAQSGKIMIDNQNIYDFSKQSLREQIAIIPQDTSLFHRSLMDNIRYGRLDATDEAVIEAEKRHMHMSL